MLSIQDVIDYCNALPPHGIRFGSFSTPNRAGVHNLRRLGLRIFEIDGGIIKNKRAAQGHKQCILGSPPILFSLDLLKGLVQKRKCSQIHANRTKGQDLARV